MLIESSENFDRIGILELEIRLDLGVEKNELDGYKILLQKRDQEKPYFPKHNLYIRDGPGYSKPDMKKNSKHRPETRTFFSTQSISVVLDIRKNTGKIMKI